MRVNKMRLYYYTAKQWGMKALWEKRLKVSEYEQLNDPFELLPFQLKSEADAELSAHLKAVLAKHSGIICFSEVWTNHLMWAHYGDKHRGMCLGFDVPNSHPGLTKIQYIAKRVECPEDLRSIDTPLSRDTLNTLLCRKHDAWAYEREHRLLLPFKDAVDGIRYQEFDLLMQLREVILGAKCTLTPPEVSDAIDAHRLESVRVLKACTSNDNFDVIEDKSVPAVTLAGFTDEQKEMKNLVAALQAVPAQ
nr:DUF2971 domain-containing protein [uncultured Rhodoferax sp.]